MKKHICVLLALLLCVPFWGCGKKNTANTVPFYYPRQTPVYHAENGIISYENREISDPNDLAEILKLYLAGPLDNTLAPPFPNQTHLLETRLEDGTLTVILSRHFSSLDGTKMTVACACLAKTCLELTKAQQITVVSDSFSITLNAASFTLFDDSITGNKPKNPTLEETQ